MYYLLLYDVVPDYVEKRVPFRSEHFELAKAAKARGELVLAGAFGDPVEGAALVFRGDDAQLAEDFAKTDPYVRRGLVTRWRVCPWNVVIGGE